MTSLAEPSSKFSPLITGAGVVISGAQDISGLTALLVAEQPPVRSTASLSSGLYPYAALPDSFSLDSTSLNVLSQCLLDLQNSSGLSADELTDERTALVLAAAPSLQPRWNPGLPPDLIGTAAPATSFGESSLAEYAARDWGLRGPVYSISTACASSASAMIVAAELLRAGSVDRAIVGGAEIMTWFDIHGFHSAGLLDRHGARPFDVDRRGLMLGEGGGLVMMEAPTAQREPIGILRGWSTAIEREGVATPESSGETLRRCIRASIINAGLRAGEIGYVNAHAPGTVANDLSEALALSQIWSPDDDTMIGSTKGLHGHLRTAAGIIELIFSLVALNHRLVPPTYGCTNPDPACRWRCPLDAPVRRDALYAMSVSRGFGGVDVALVVERSRRG
jgi:hypothetical protein